MVFLNFKNMNSLSQLRLGFIIAVAALMCACSTLDASSPPELEGNTKWGLLPFVNHTETPQAGLRAESIAEALLRSQSINVVKYPSGLNTETLFEPMSRLQAEESLKWAKSEGIRYALTGSVEEWRYKVGIDGEPAAGITLNLIDLQRDEIIWSAAGGRTGWSREGLSSVGQKLMRKLLTPLVTVAR